MYYGSLAHNKICSTAYIIGSGGEVCGEFVAGIQNPTMRMCIEISQIGNWDFELDGLRLSWGEAHFLERLQLLGRALEKRILLTYIELHDFLSVTRTDILYLYGRLQDPVCRNLRTDIDLTILELGVAEAMAEREQRADAFGVKPAVADVDALFIVDVFPAGVGAECVCRGVFDSYRER